MVLWCASCDKLVDNFKSPQSASWSFEDYDSTFFIFALWDSTRLLVSLLPVNSRSRRCCIRISVMLLQSFLRNRWWLLNWHTFQIQLSHQHAFVVWKHAAFHKSRATDACVHQATFRAVHLQFRSPFHVKFTQLYHWRTWECYRNGVHSSEIFVYDKHFRICIWKAFLNKCLQKTRNSMLLLRCRKCIMLQHDSNRTHSGRPLQKEVCAACWCCKLHQARLLPGSTWMPAACAAGIQNMIFSSLFLSLMGSTLMPYFALQLFSSSSNCIASSWPRCAHFSLWMSLAITAFPTQT